MERRASPPVRHGTKLPTFSTCIFRPYHSIFIYMPQIHIPSPLRQYSGKQASVDVPAKTVGEALAGLVSRHPELKRHLYNDEGKLRSFVNVYVNDEDMRYLQKEATALKDGDTISIVPSIAGGLDQAKIRSALLDTALYNRGLISGPDRKRIAVGHSSAGVWLKRQSDLNFYS
ncbi:MAG: MoaD/ThiS family protein [Terriglobales bacterium]|jgi:molybdopterin synthase sulfur carrier subunit